MTKIFFSLGRTSEKQHCDKAKTEEGEKIADGAINVCLRGPRKEFNYTGTYFLVPLVRVCESQGEEDRLFGRARGEFHFRVPHEDDGPPPAAVDGNREQGKKKGPRAFVSPASFAAILRGVTRSIYSARGSGGMQRG